VATKTSDKAVTLVYNLLAQPTIFHKAGLAGLLLYLDDMKRRGVKSRPAYDFLGDNEVSVHATESQWRGMFNDLFAARCTTQVVKKKEKRVVEPYLRYFDQYPEPWAKFRRQAFKHFWNRHTVMDSTFGRCADKRDAKAVDFEDLDSRMAMKEYLSIGKQAGNAERVCLNDHGRSLALLYFWQFASGAFMRPVEGKKSEWHHVYAIPDIINLKLFVGCMPGSVKQAMENNSKGKNLPLYAIVLLPVEASLRYGHMVHDPESIAGVEYHEVTFKQNGVNVFAVHDLPYDDDVLVAYNNIKARYIHPVFLKAEITALVNGTKWHREISPLLAGMSVREIVPGSSANEETKASAARFCVSAYRKLKEMREMDEASQVVNPALPATIEQIVPDLVRGYIRARLDKSGESPRALDKVCEQLLLDVRSRQGQAVIDYFVSTFCSAPQFMGRRKNQAGGSTRMEVLVEFLRGGDWRWLKNLTLIAIAGSRFVSQKKEKDNAATAH
jgi:CRISPR-associated protein Cmx8